MMSVHSSLLTLSRIRLVVQVVMLAFTVYGGGMVGHYAAEKVTGALPALSCAYDQQNSAYCVLIPIQHQLHHRVGEAIVKLQGFTFSTLLPLLFTLLSFLAFFVVLNKAFCGWVCPMGTVQELINRLGRRLDAQAQRLSGRRLDGVRLVKWAVLVVLVMALPLIAGLGLGPHAMGDAYCQVCPSRIVTTLMTGDTEQMAVPVSGDWVATGFAAFRNALLGFVVVAALSVRQPFCRICPMLALHALFRRVAPLRLVKIRNERCDKCGLCAKACPMDIREIQTTHGPKAFHEDCTLCGRCAEFCPDDGVISLKFGPVPLFASSKAYFQRRSRQDMPDGRPKRTPPRGQEV